MKANVATYTFIVPLFHVLRHYALLYRIKRDFQARNITESNPGYHILLWIHVAFMAKGSVLDLMKVIPWSNALSTASMKTTRLVIASNYLETQ